MRKLVLRCAVALGMAMSTMSEARPPAEVSVGFHESDPSKPLVGVASWYGEEAAGNRTASGEVYDINGLTAAHRDFPLGTIVTVTNLRNNRSITLRINDRGPFIPGRVIDVSKAAAKSLGFLNAGLTRVRIEIVLPHRAKSPRPPLSPSVDF